MVWKEAPELAIHSVLTGGVSPMVLKDCARAAWSHPQARSAAGWAERAGVQYGAERGAAPVNMAAGWS